MSESLLEIPEMMSIKSALNQGKLLHPQPEPEGKMVTGDVSKLQPNIQ